MKKSGSGLCWCLKSKEQNTAISFSSQSPHRSKVYKNFLRSLQWLDKGFERDCSLFCLKAEHIPRLGKFPISLQKAVKRAERLNISIPSFSLHIVVGVMIFMTLGATVTKTPSCKFDWFCKLISFVVGVIRIYFSFLCLWSNALLCVSCNVVALTEENLLFLEAWRAIDRAYVDKTFNGQSWFRYRENALRVEPMNTREETCKFLRFEDRACIIIYVIQFLNQCAHRKSLKTLRPNGISKFM